MSSVKQQTGATENLVRVSAEILSTVAPSSREQMIEHGTRFVQFVHSKNTKVDLRTIDERAVNEYLRFFYFTLRTKQDKLYSPSSLICIRAGIQRYFDVVLGRPLILPGNPVFMTSNRMLGQRARNMLAPVAAPCDTMRQCCTLTVNCLKTISMAAVPEVTRWRSVYKMERYSRCSTILAAPHRSTSRGITNRPSKS
ncbi:hypothetical protein BOX15_Mlig029737g3 [Macrostomum lignano]|uniref:Uncharacterized protein n=1 Tax=Macrostomum lignano TaxID=282301 RepID=A0A267DNP2_9PLAT|nr:hypothetical protein BOX15_Mlig029737g3 [Macrostomum lignano]